MDPTALEEFSQHRDAFQFYLELVLSTFALSLTATSGVAAYLAKPEGGLKNRAVVLVLPGLLCLGLGLGFWRQVSAAEELRDRMIVLSRSLGFGLAPHGGILVNALGALGALLLLTALSLFGSALILPLKHRRSRNVAS